MERFKRVPLQVGDKLEITVLDFDKGEIQSGNYVEKYQEYINIVRMVSRFDDDKKDYVGTSSLVYEGIMGSGNDTKRVIIKEFYPQNITKMNNDFIISRNSDKTLSFNRAMNEILKDEMSAREEQFLDCYEKQWKMTQGADLEIKEFVVLPICFAKAGDSFYIISDIHGAESLDQAEFNTIEEKLDVLYHLADMLISLEHRKEIFMDLSLDNVMYIKRNQQIKMFDVDSIIDYSDLSRVKLSDIRYHRQYASEMIRLIEENADVFEEKKKIYLSESSCRKSQIYSLGILGYTFIFGHIPTDKERRFEDLHKGELAAQCIKEGLSRECAKELIQLLGDMIREEYSTAEKVCEMLKKLHDKILKGNKVKELNYRYLAYRVLEENPAYYFADKLEDGGYNLDVSIIGEHSMRTAIVKAVLPGIQMLKTDLNIRIFSNDAEKFWKELCKGAPLLPKATRLYVNDVEQEVSFDKELVDSPLANIFLYTIEDFKEILEHLKGKSTYIWCVQENHDHNVEFAKQIVNLKANKLRFIAYLDNEERIVEIPTSKAKKMKTHVMCSNSNALEYDENTYKSSVEKLGLDIHAFYSLGNDSKTAMSDIEKDYKSNSYYRESSERSALHTKYKLASIGLDDWKDKKFSAKLYTELFDKDNVIAQKNFDDLVQLEHRSWEAFMIMDGWSTLPLDQFKEVAYKNGNSWKDSENLKQPFLVESKVGRKLRSEVDWSARKADNNWDKLDRQVLVCIS